MKLKISTQSEVPGFSGDFATIEAEREDDITMQNCRNVVAHELAMKAFRTGEKQQLGMWIVTPHTE